VFTTNKQDMQNALENGAIVVPLEGGWMVFNYESEYETWARQL
jgi:hypothetical protein